MKRLQETLTRTAGGAALLGGLILALATTGCSTTQKGDGGSISKVRYFHLDPTRPVVPTDDAMVAFERRYRQHGALTAEDRRERDGHYYTVWWSAADRSQPVTVRLEYRQRDDAMNVRMIEQQVANPGRSEKSFFELTGDAYREGGPVVAHRVVLLQGGSELVDWKSYLWE